MESNFSPIWGLILLMTFLACMCQSKYFNTDSEKSKTVAKVRSDNDFSTSLDTISPTELVPQKVENVVLEILKENSGALKFNQVFKIRSIKAFSIYVLKVIGDYDMSRYYFIGYNPDNKMVTLKPPFIQGKWMEENERGFKERNRLIQKPFLFFEDLDKDGKTEIAVKERVHNGNIYNAAICTFFDLNSEMIFKKKCVFELVQKDIFSDCFLVRQVTRNVVIVNKICGDESEPIEIGSFELTGDFSELTNLKLQDERYSGFLVTGSGTPDSIFLKNGPR